MQSRFKRVSLKFYTWLNTMTKFQFQSLGSHEIKLSRTITTACLCLNSKSIQQFLSCKIVKNELKISMGLFSTPTQFTMIQTKIYATKFFLFLKKLEYVWTIFPKRIEGVLILLMMNLWSEHCEDLRKVQNNFIAHPYSSLPNPRFHLFPFLLNSKHKLLLES